MKWLVRQGILWHRNLGACFCLFFASWFVSGIVLMYAGFPQMSETERLAHLPQLDLSAATLTPSEAFARTGLTSFPRRITMDMVNGRPVYRFRSLGARYITVDADSGQILDKLDASTAIQIARTYHGDLHSDMHVVRELLDVDQWTVFPRARPYLPFFLIDANDEASTKYYVSQATGSVYLQTTRRSRLLAWCGAIPHWWYVRALRVHDSVWQWVVIIAAGWGIVMCVAGIVTGILRFSPSRRYRFPGPEYSSVPYAGWKRWHYVVASIFGLTTLTWIFSGLMTLNPGNWSPGADPSTQEIRAFAGNDLDPDTFRLAPMKAAGALQGCIQPTEIELMAFSGRPYYLAKGRDARIRLLLAEADSHGCISEVSTEELLKAGQNVVPGGAITDSSLLTAYDSYYYDREKQKPLPVFRIRFADSQRTWLYLNPQTATIEARLTSRSRLERWLYFGLHDLDFPFLYTHRPAWDLTVIALSLGGIALSGTGILLAVKYTRKKYKKRRYLTQLASGGFDPR